MDAEEKCQAACNEDKSCTAYVYKVAEATCDVWRTEVAGDGAPDPTCNIKQVDLGPYVANKGQCAPKAKVGGPGGEPADPGKELAVSSEGECRKKCTEDVPQCFAFEYGATKQCRHFYQETKKDEGVGD